MVLDVDIHIFHLHMFSTESLGERVFMCYRIEVSQLLLSLDGR
jgi:hypothetical protein